MEMERGNPRAASGWKRGCSTSSSSPAPRKYGDQYWRGYTYVWNDEQTDAELLDAKGLDATLHDQGRRQGRSSRTYHFPSRAECTLCHTNAAKFALGVNTLQMNRDHDYGGVVANQLATLEHIGMFTKPLPEPPEKLPKLADYRRREAARRRRAPARTCTPTAAHCHMQVGRRQRRVPSCWPRCRSRNMGIVNVPPGHGASTSRTRKLLVPGDPERSLILHRMTQTGLGRMPHIGSRVVDESAVKLVREWIKQLPAEPRTK